MYLARDESVTKRVWLDSYADSLDSAAAALDPCYEPGLVRLGNGAVGAAAARAQHRTAVQQPPCWPMQPLHGGRLRDQQSLPSAMQVRQLMRGMKSGPEDPRGLRRQASRGFGGGGGRRGRSRHVYAYACDPIPCELAHKVLAPGSAESPNMFSSQLPDYCLRLYQRHNMRSERMAWLLCCSRCCGLQCRELLSAQCAEACIHALLAAEADCLQYTGQWTQSVG